MGRTIAIAIIALSASFPSGCAQPGGSPPSAKQPIAASADGLGNLFRQECIEQRNLSWVQQESARLVSQCAPLNHGDCLMKKDGMVSWAVPTTADQEVTVSMFWNPALPSRKAGPPTGKLSCSISTSEALGDAIQVAAAQVAESDPTFGKPWKFRGGGGQLWPSVDATHTIQLELYHRPNVPKRFGLSNWELRYAVIWQVPLSREYLIDPSETPSGSVQ